MRLWIAKRKASYLTDKVCSVCESTNKLQIDHIDPTTKISHNIWSWSQERREAELVKCQILCKLCHDKKSQYEHAIGERAGAAKLSNSEVDEIRLLFKQGTPTLVIAKLFSVHIRTIQKLVYGTNGEHSHRLAATRYTRKDL